MENITHLPVSSIRYMDTLGTTKYFNVFIKGSTSIVLNENDLLNYGISKNKLDKELDNFKEEFLSIINQNKTAEEILLDLKDHLTN